MLLVDRSRLRAAREGSTRYGLGAMSIYGSVRRLSTLAGSHQGSGNEMSQTSRRRAVPAVRLEAVAWTDRTKPIFDPNSLAIDPVLAQNPGCEPGQIELKMTAAPRDEDLVETR